MNNIPNVFFMYVIIDAVGYEHGQYVFYIKINNKREIHKDLRKNWNDPIKNNN